MVIQIKIHPLLDSLNEATFLKDLLHAYGIADVDAYLNPESIEYQSPDMYKNMDVAILLLKQHLTKMSQIAVLCDTDNDVIKAIALAYRSGYLRAKKGRPFKIGGEKE